MPTNAVQNCKDTEKRFKRQIILPKRTKTVRYRSSCQANRAWTSINDPGCGYDEGIGSTDF